MPTPLNYAERLILLQALICRRVPTNSRIQPVLLMEALQADNELVREQVPHFYFADYNLTLSQEVHACVEAGYIDDGSPKPTRRSRTVQPKPKTYQRTQLGEQFLRSLEPRLQDALDEMPMSDVGVLDFLSLI